MGTKPRSLGSHAHRRADFSTISAFSCLQRSRIFKAPRKREFRRSRSGAHGRAPATGGSARLSGALKRALRTVPAHASMPARYTRSILIERDALRAPPRLMNLMKATFIQEC